MKLTIVIPAYNEERAIASIIERTLEARAHIMADSPVSAVEIVVVSDGSTDQTVAIARTYDDIKLIVFEKNRGYGAAIQRGFAAGNGELVGFLDADGTCDPGFFADLCRGLCAEGAAIALGSRMGPDSHMPRLRRMGNRIYAALLSLLTNRVVHDTASGMRVIRRDALERLYPLPDGLNFTPAMSARALLDDNLPILELPMTYEERVGESKLSVVRDGWRFFQTIMEMTLLLRPARVFLSGALGCFLLTLLFGLYPLEMWLTQHRLEESMIYRLLFCSFVGSVGVLCLSALTVAEALRVFSAEQPARRTLSQRVIDGLFSVRSLVSVAAILVPMIAWLVGPGIWTWLVERQVHLHWSRVVFAGLLAFTLCQMFVTRIILNVAALHAHRLRHLAKARKSIRQATAPLRRAQAARQPEESKESAVLLT